MGVCCRFNATKTRFIKAEWKKNFNYPVLPYPKGENKNYILGDYIKPQIVLKEQKCVGKNNY
jgi:hypothetical protein